MYIIRVIDIMQYDMYKDMYAETTGYVLTYAWLQFITQLNIKSTYHINTACIIQYTGTVLNYCMTRYMFSL